MTTRNTTKLVPNLDAMSPCDLSKFWVKHQAGVNVARSLFPNRPKGYVTVTRRLANYAINKSVAMQLRIAGDIPGAEKYESICEKIYDQLPTWARW